MSDQKFIRIALAVVVIIFLGFIFSIMVDRPTLTIASAVTPPPRTPDTPRETPSSPDNEESDKAKSTGPVGSISGQVIDLATGRPAAGIKVEINGEIVATDGRGHYSRTGLEAGTYLVRLLLPPGIAATQTVWEVVVGQNEEVHIDLSLNSQTPPTATPTSQSPTPTPLPPQESAALPPTPTPVPPPSQQAIPTIFTPVGDDPILWINPGYINNEQGVAGFITIDVMNVIDLGAFQAKLEFDPKIIEIDSVLLGDFLDSTGRQTTPLVTEVDNSSGEVSFVAFTSGDKAGPDGGGTLAVVNFFSKQAGVSDLVLDEVRLVTRLGEIIQAEVGSGQVNVSACFGDLNGDKIIDIGDLQIVAGRVGQVLGDINYQSGYDVNSDGVIDETDVVLITDRLYEICP